MRRESGTTKGCRAGRAGIAGIATAVALAGLAAVGPVVGPAAAGVVSIQPSLVEAAIEPGDDATTVVRIHYAQDGPGDTEPVRVILGAEDWDMDTRGRLSFRAGTPGTVGATGEPTDSARPWIVFSPSEAEISPGQSLTVRVSVIVPDDAARGEYRAALIAQPRAPFRPLEPGEKRLDLHCRLASIFYVQVGPVAEAIELAGLQVVRKSEQWSLVPTFLNGGEAHVRVSDEFEILPIGDQVEGLLCFRDMQESGVVLPGQSRDLEHPLPCELPAGHYRVVYRADAGRHLPVMEGETTFEIPASDGVAPPVVATAEEAGGAG